MPEQPAIQPEDARARGGGRLRFGGALVLGVLLAGAALAWWPPSQRPRLPSDPVGRGEALEQAVAAAVTRVRASGSERWAVAVDTADLNAWLATRLPKWIEHDPGLAEFEPATRLRLGAVDGALVVETPVGPALLGLVGTLHLPVAVVERDGAASLGISVGRAAVGRLPLPGIDRLDGLGDRARDAVARLGARREGLRFGLADGRSVEVHAIECAAGRVVVECSTHPAVAPAPGATAAP